MRSGSKIRSVGFQEKPVARNIAQQGGDALPIGVLFRPGDVSGKGYVPAAVEKSPRFGYSVRPAVDDSAIPSHRADASVVASKASRECTMTGRLRARLQAETRTTPLLRRCRACRVRRPNRPGRSAQRACSSSGQGRILPGPDRACCLRKEAFVHKQIEISVQSLHRVVAVGDDGSVRPKTG